MRVDRWNPRQDGPLDEAGFRQTLQAMGYSVSRYVYAPGTYFPMHTHEVDKIDAVVSGHFRVTMGEDEMLLGAGDAVHIPRGVEHSAEVVGDESVVSLDGEKRPSS
jgi:quercetin dioxygenase-like cupin family protein